MKEKLFGKSLEELKVVVTGLGLPGYTGKQIATWLYKKEITSIDEMTDLSKKARTDLEEKYELGIYPPDSEMISSDDTAKYLFKVHGNNFIEAAFIPEIDRATICVSSQAGCKFACKFCMTGRQGFQGNLSAGEILNQFRSIPGFQRITNIVYMGMGEPLDNISEVLKSITILTSDWGYAMSPRRITVSTVGIISALNDLIEKSEAHIAISLHTPFDEERAALMPVQKSNPLKEVLNHIRSYEITGQRRISFEYIVFKGHNDTQRHVNELARILNGIRCRINLIRYHKVPGTDLESPPYDDVVKFRDALTAKGIITTIRASRGEDIMAACGMLSTLEKQS